MRLSQNIALSAFAATVVAGLSACTTHDYDVRAAYGCVPGTPNVTETCNYPTYAGNIQIDGMPRPFLHYRDSPAGREFYVDGKWRKADPGTPDGRA